MCASLCKRRYINIYILYLLTWLQSLDRHTAATAVTELFSITLCCSAWTIGLCLWLATSCLLSHVHLCNSHQRLNRGEMSHSVAKAETQCEDGCCWDKIYKIVCNHQHTVYPSQHIGSGFPGLLPVWTKHPGLKSKTSALRLHSFI